MKLQIGYIPNPSKVETSEMYIFNSNSASESFMNNYDKGYKMIKV